MQGRLGCALWSTALRCAGCRFERTLGRKLPCDLCGRIVDTVLSLGRRVYLCAVLQPIFRRFGCFLVSYSR